MDTCKTVTEKTAAGSTAANRNTRYLAVAVAGSALLISGCYVVPVGSSADGQPNYVYSTAPIIPGQIAGVPPAIKPAGPAPAVLTVRLYPANDLANQTGVLNGQVTNMMSGKGRFQFTYQGESLTGEATRVSGDERRGMASAYGGKGTFARCDYQMSTPYQGAGTCTFSNGANYQLHIGN